MSNVFALVNRFFLYFISRDDSLLIRLINFITDNPYLLIGVTCLIIGFCISILRRIIHS